METKKLKLGELTVNSYVTNINESEKHTINGKEGLLTWTIPYTTVGVNPVVSAATTISLTIASYVNCPKIGEELGDKFANKFCGDSRGWVCSILLTGC